MNFIKIYKEFKTSDKTTGNSSFKASFKNKDIFLRKWNYSQI